MTTMSLRVLFATGSAPGYMMPPILGSEQVICGPDWPDALTSDGRVSSLRTPAGQYDLGMIAARLPQEQQPDVVVCLVDASWRNLPRNLGSIKCPRVLLVADTHHLQAPLNGMLRYATSESFTRVVLLYDRHHAGVFRGAGVENLYWFPGLTFPHEDAIVRSARRSAKDRKLAFVGQSGQFHPRRKRLLESMKARGLPLSIEALPQSKAVEFYGRSLVGFNASLNGDLNLRIFEILSSGSALLTDRLSPSSGLGILPETGILQPYTSAEELAERAADALAHPKETALIGARGASWFDAYFNAEQRRAAFLDLAFDGKIRPEFAWSIQETRTRFFGTARETLSQAAIVYEAIQELHRTQETVRVSLDPSVPADFLDLCRTLPRVCITRDLATPEGVDWRILDRTQGPVEASPAPRVWLWNALPKETNKVHEQFLQAGFIPLRAGCSAFQRLEANIPLPSGTFGAQAVELLERGDVKSAFALAKSALDRRSGSADACFVIAILAISAGNHELAVTTIERGLRFDPRNERLRRLRAQRIQARGGKVEPDSRNSGENSHSPNPKYGVKRSEPDQGKKEHELAKPESLIATTAN